MRAAPRRRPGLPRPPSPVLPDESGGAPSRRHFLAVSLATVAFALAIPSGSACRPTSIAFSRRPAFATGGWLTIDSDGQVTLLVGQTELGQGIHTAMAMLVAEELGCAWESITVQHAVADAAFDNPLMQRQRTAWSASVRGWWKPLREAGAGARTMLVQAAAARWKVSPGGCSVEPGVVHGPGGETATFAELAPEAGKLPAPRRVSLKPASAFTIIGRDRARIELADKVTGGTRYGIDVRLPGMLFGVLARPPHPGAIAVPTDSERLENVRVVETAAGVAFLAPNTWLALRARERAAIEWHGGSPLSPTDGLRERLAHAIGNSAGVEDLHAGDVKAALQRAHRRVSAEYYLPYVAHAAMEPLNCTAEVRDGRCRVLVPTQDQTAAHAAAVEASGCAAAAVTVETTLAGGGFGRRVHPDVVREAVTVARKAGVPVQLVWSREDDLRHDFFRPASLHRLSAGVLEGGRIEGWSHLVAGQGTTGAADMPYRFSSARVAHHDFIHPIPTGIWRAVDHGPNAFAIECFLDEIASGSSQDPIQLRRDLLQDHPRAGAVLELAAAQSGWQGAMPGGHGRGVALHGMVGTWVAVVIEVAVDRPARTLRVLRAIAAIDCGTAVNPDGIRAQVEGSIAMGLSAALHEAVEVRNGGVVTANFDRYHLLRIGGMPMVEVHLVPSQADPGGVGEPALPPVAPALLNAIAAATGIRIRTLPVGNQLRDQLG